MSEKLEFSPEAKAVFEAGKEIFAYYHAQDFSTKPYNVNASLYDIKVFSRQKLTRQDESAKQSRGFPLQNPHRHTHRHPQHFGQKARTKNL